MNTSSSDIDITKRQNDFEDEKANEESQFISFNQQSMKTKKKTPQQELDEKLDKVKDWATFIRDKLESLAWIAAAVGIIYYSNFFHIFFYHEKINILFSNIFLIMVAVNVVFAIHATVILPYILKVTIPIEQYQPKIIYLGAITGFMGFLSLIIAIWPAFGWFSPPMVLIMFLGFLNTSQFLPSNAIGSILFGLIFIGAFYSHYFIEHSGHLH